MVRLRWSFGSGPEVATLFARGLALLSLGAWLSLGVQVKVLIGSRGLLPVADLIERARAQPDVAVGELGHPRRERHVTHPAIKPPAGPPGNSGRAPARCPGGRTRVRAAAHARLP